MEAEAVGRQRTLGLLVGQMGFMCVAYVRSFFYSFSSTSPQSLLIDTWQLLQQLSSELHYADNSPKNGITHTHVHTHTESYARCSSFNGRTHSRQGECCRKMEHGGLNRVWLLPCLAYRAQTSQADNDDDYRPFFLDRVHRSELGLNQFTDTANGGGGGNRSHTATHADDTQRTDRCYVTSRRLGGKRNNALCAQAIRWEFPHTSWARALTSNITTHVTERKQRIQHHRTGSHRVRIGANANDYRSAKYESTAGVCTSAHAPLTPWHDEKTYR